MLWREWRDESGSVSCFKAKDYGQIQACERCFQVLLLRMLESNGSFREKWEVNKVDCFQ